MASQLDAIALDRLKQWRSTAESEIQETIREKRRELDVMIQRAKDEAEAILERAKTAPPPNASLTMRNTPAMQFSHTNASASFSSATPAAASAGTTATGRSRDSSVPAPENPTAVDRSSSAAVASELFETGSSDESVSLSSDNFKRIPTRGQRSTTSGDTSSTSNHTTISSSLSALSASFALRGRQGPTPMDDWAQKRRLKARYPDGDHSVMTSAATSAANSYSEPPSEAEAENDDQDDEEESRGRGRERGARVGPGSSRERDSDNRAGRSNNVGTTHVPPGTVARPSMAPSSLTSAPHKSRASTSLDLGESHDAGTPKSTGTLGGLASPSAQINLRPRNPPPSNTEPLKPATRMAKKVGEGNDTGGKTRQDKAKSKRESGAEKKVAFAETTDEAASRDDQFADSDDEGDDGKALVDQRGTGVFDIDEDIEEEDGSLESERNGQSDGDGQAEALVGAAEKLRLTDTATAAPGDDEEESGAGHSHSRASNRSTDEELGGMRASVGAQYAGSFSALAASLQQGDRWSSVGQTRRANVEQAEPGFDPASLRLDGRVALSPRAKQALSAANGQDRRSSSRTRGGSAARDLTGPTSSDYDVDARQDGRGDSRQAGRDRNESDAATTWDRKITSIGYRTTIGDTEVHLSGLLAPHAPSHRRLWVNEKKRQDKYILEEDDEELEEEHDGQGAPKQGSGAGGAKASSAEDQQWTAWQRRAQEMDSQHNVQGKAGKSGESQLAQSVPTHQRGDGGRATTSWMRGTIGNAGPKDSRQIPITAGSRGRGDGGSTVYDGTSGFDREPKTSLPYQERKMVPSLRKATRMGAFDMQRKPSLPTIPDTDVEENSPNVKQDDEDGDDAVQKSKDIAKGIAIERASVKTSASNVSANVEDARAAGSLLPGSQVKRGFEMPFGAGHTPGQGGTVQPAGADPHMLAPSELTNVQAGATLSPPIGSGHLTPSSAHSGRSGSSPGRRSPRPPYVAPPPPTSTSIVLEPDPKQKPGPWSLFKVSANSKFAYNEEGEEEETDWDKVLMFMHRVERLKVNKRTGWLHHRVPRAESIADHMYRMAMLAMLCPNDVDIGKCVLLALVHDLAEAEVGDLTPLDGVSKEEKTRREAEALAYLVHDLLGSSPAALRLEALWHEYEERESLESKLVKDLDRFELILQAVEYERAHDIVDLQPFFSCAGDITHPRIRKWTVELAKEREAMWKEKLGQRFAYEQALPSEEDMKSG